MTCLIASCYDAVIVGTARYPISEIDKQLCAEETKLLREINPTKPYPARIICTT
jgi:hypothetical protein